MGKVIVSENVTLDGVVQDPAGDEGFERGGWVGMISDRFSGTFGNGSLGFALCVVGVLNLWAAAHYLRGARDYRAEVARSAG